MVVSAIARRTGSLAHTGMVCCLSAAATIFKTASLVPNTIRLMAANPLKTLVAGLTVFTVATPFLAAAQTATAPSLSESLSLGSPAYCLEHYPEFSAELAVQSGISNLSAEGWQEIGKGNFRSVFEHPQLPGRVLKIGDKEQALAHVNSTEFAKELIARHKLTHLTVPDSKLVKILETQGIAVLLEEKMAFGESPKAVREKMKSDPKFKERVESYIEELETLKQKGRFCDIFFRIGQNARLLKNNRQIGLFDLDCRIA